MCPYSLYEVCLSLHLVVADPGGGGVGGLTPQTGFFLLVSI